MGLWLPLPSHRAHLIERWATIIDGTVRVLTCTGS